MLAQKWTAKGCEMMQSPPVTVSCEQWSTWAHDVVMAIYFRAWVTAGAVELVRCAGNARRGRPAARGVWGECGAGVGVVGEVGGREDTDGWRGRGRGRRPRTRRLRTRRLRTLTSWVAAPSKSKHSQHGEKIFQ